MLKEKAFPASLASLPAMQAALRGEAAAHTGDERMLQRLELAAEEILANIIHYAYAGGEGKIYLSADWQPERQLLRFTFEAEGTPYDPLTESEAPALAARLDERPVGGLGGIPLPHHHGWRAL